MYVKMEAMMIVKDDRASLAEEDGMNSQANTDGFRELMGITKYFDLFKMTLMYENITSIFIIKCTHLESFNCWHL